MNKIINNLRLKSKIAIIIVITAFPILITASILLIFLTGRIFENINISIDNAKISVRNSFEFYKKQSYIYAKMFSEDIDVKRGVSFNNTSLLTKALPSEKEMSELGLDIVTIHKNDNEQTILAQSHFPRWFNIPDKDNELVKEAINGGTPFAIIKYNTPDKKLSKDRVALISVLPIFHQSGEFIVGTITVGYRIDTRFLREIKKLSGIDTLITSDEKIIASSFGKLKTTKSNVFDATNKVIKINSREYDIGYVAIEDNEYLKNLNFIVTVDNEEIKKALFNFFLIITTVSVIVIALAIFVAVKIASNITKNTSKIMEGTKQMASHNYDVNIKLDTKDEFKELSTTFNDMALKIKDSFYRIKEYNEHLEEMVEKRTIELDLLNKTLKQKNEEMLKELEMAERVQRSIIPSEKDFPKREELNFGSRYSSMENIGGDIYDVIRVGRNSYGFLIADVSGHGVPAALITSMAKVYFNANSGWGISPSAVCDKVNRGLFSLIGDLEYYLTAYYGIINLEEGTFSYTNAGHHPAILIHPNGETESLDTKGFFIGAFDPDLIEYENGIVKLQEGDRILFFTDGIVEARNTKGDFYEYRRLMNYINNKYKLPPKEFVDGLVEDVEIFCEGEPPYDDRAILFIEFISKMKPDIPINEAILIETRNIESSETKEFKKLYKDAVNYIKSNIYDKALKILLEMNIKYPNNPKVLNNLGIVYYKLNNLKDAYDILKNAIEVDDKNETLKKNLNKVIEKLNRN